MLSRPFTLYHFTDPANLPSIRERGLLPASLGVVNRPREKAVSHGAAASLVVGHQEWLVSLFPVCWMV